MKMQCVETNQIEMKNLFDLHAIYVYRVWNGRHLSISCFADIRFFVVNVIRSIPVNQKTEMKQDKEKKKTTEETFLFWIFTYRAVAQSVRFKL